MGFILLGPVCFISVPRKPVQVILVDNYTAHPSR
jgi:hypothetical protein